MVKLLRMNTIKRVAIVGGIHGNELTGVYLIKKFEQYPQLISRDSFETLVLLGNPKAFAEGRRYVDKDLNRSFISQDLQDSTLTSYEDIRAKAIYQMLIPQDLPPVDVIVDLHSTTAKMGLSIILGSKHPFLLKLAAYLSDINPLVKVCSTPPGNRGYLRSLCELGFVIEVGAVAQGVLDAELFQKTEQLIYTIIDYFSKFNQGIVIDTNHTVEFFEYVGAIDYPRNEFGEIQAMIHPQLQFKDYQPLNPGDPIFLTFDGKEIIYEGTSTVYPIFINEAAYYEKGVAMCLTSKQQLTV